MLTEKQMQKMQANPEKLAKQLNDLLPSFDKLAEHEMLGRIIGLETPRLLRYDPTPKLQLIANAVQKMMNDMTQVKWYSYYSVEDNEAVVYDWNSREYKVTMEEFEVLTKMMFTEWLGMKLDFTLEQQDIYYAFKYQSNMSRILN